MSSHNTPPNDTAAAISHQATSGGVLTDADWLDDHYAAMQPEYEQMLRRVGLQPGWTVLDAGCGGGSYVPLLAELVGATGRILATDIAPENVQRLSNRIQARACVCPVEVHQGDVLALPFPDASVDALWCAAVSQYLSDAQLLVAFREFKRVVRPSGLIAVKEADLATFHFGHFPNDAIWRFLIAISAANDGVTLNGVNVNTRGVLRAPGFQALFRTLGLEQISATTIIGERRPPLTSVEWRFLANMLSFTSDVALVLNLPAADQVHWQALKGIEQPDHILRSQNFFYREGHNVTIGRVPHMSTKSAK